MPFSYKPLFKTLIDKDLSKEDLRRAIGAAPSTFTRINKGESVSLDLLDRICTRLDVPIEAVIRHEKENRTGEGEAL